MKMSKRKDPGSLAGPQRCASGRRSSPLVALSYEDVNTNEKVQRRAPKAPQKQPRLPKMGRHSSGQARVTIQGKVHYLGAHGSPEAHA